MDTPPSSNLRSRTRIGDPKPVRAAVRPSQSGQPSQPLPSQPAQPTQLPQTMRRNPPHLPTPLEAVVLSIFPVILLFGTAFTLLSPQTRAAHYDPFTQAHSQDSFAPSYFAQKSNLFNTLFVKRGWFWTSAAFFSFLFTHPATKAQSTRVQGAVRWGLVTGWWFLVTQWCFGPAIIDRGFRWTGGKCELIEEKVEIGEGDMKEVFTSVACKAVGGNWRGGHDISGHVFLLVLGSAFLLQEVGWVVLRYTGRRREERSVVMTDGATKSATVEAQAERGTGAGLDGLGPGGKFAIGVVGLSCWMLLMTAIYFHTWFEKLTGLITAVVALYGVYVLPRVVPAVRQVVGLPGI